MSLEERFVGRFEFADDLEYVLPVVRNWLAGQLGAGVAGLDDVHALSKRLGRKRNLLNVLAMLHRESPQPRDRGLGGNHGFWLSPTYENTALKHLGAAMRAGRGRSHRMAKGRIFAVAARPSS